MNMHKKYPHFSKLIEINTSYFKDKTNNIRLYEEDIEYLEELLNNLWKSIETKNINYILSTLLTTTGKILYLQPFYDGNSRTLKTYISIILNNLGYSISYNNNDFIIPMLLENECCNNEEINNLKKKLTKK